MSSETYTYNVQCENCGTAVTLTIEKGTTVAVTMETANCETCGCQIKQ